jgi:hypothetical protein
MDPPPDLHPRLTVLILTARRTDGIVQTVPSEENQPVAVSAITTVRMILNFWSTGKAIWRSGDRLTH